MADQKATHQKAMNYINLVTADTLEAAETICQKLEEEGIDTELSNQDDLQRFVFWVEPKAYAFVRTQPEDYAKGARLIQEWQRQDDPICSHIFSCPSCGSLGVEYPQYTRKFFIVPMLAEMLVSLGLFEKRFYCRKCNWSWKGDKPGVKAKFANSTEVLVPPHA